MVANSGVKYEKWRGRARETERGGLQGVNTQRMNLQRGEDNGLRLVVMIVSCQSKMQDFVQHRLFPTLQGTLNGKD